MEKQVRVRFAPSPTGLLHLGGVRTALYNYIFARQHDGVFILRIEDTDQTRYVENSVENLINSMKELGIDYDEGPFVGGANAPYFQSQRLEIYHKHVKELIDKDKAYYCFCSKDTLEEMRKKQELNKETTKYDGRCKNLPQSEIQKRLDEKEPHVIRMKIPSDKVFLFHDYVRGDITIAGDLVEDQVILKADGFPTYHLACVIDDHYMQISHVLRGEEWLYSTPKHIFLYEAFEWECPIWVHLPLLLNTDRSKLSKRHGDFSVSNYINNGYLKESIINFVALLGWHAAEDREIYTINELVKEFSLERITKSGAIFDITKLDWLNGWYIRNLPLEQIAELCKPYFTEKNIDISDDVKYLKVINRARDQISKLPDIVTFAEVFYKEITVSSENLDILNQDSAKKVINAFIELLKNYNPEDNITDKIKEMSENLNIKGKNLFFPLRIALFGDCHGPDIPLLVDIYGVEESLKKLMKYHG